LVSIISILVCLALSSTLTFLSSLESIELNGTPIIYYCTLLAFLIHLIIFIPSFIYKTEKFFDFTGSLTFLSIMIFSIYLKNSIIGSIDIHSIILSILVSIWTIRLGSFLFYRIFKTGHDPRFNELKQSFFPFLMTWTLSATWVVLTLLPAMVILTSKISADISYFTFLGALIWLFGFLFEVVADFQKTSFKNNPENKDKFITEGLWGLCRHPNYFGEIILWVGIWIITFPLLSGWQYITLISPFFVYLLLTSVSGINLVEKKWKDSDEYKEYKKNVPELTPIYWN
tara:strand:- start:361 stop:1218 length:858 start_codon:yes stop_codon:yes gene_type:complete